jgi:hypothetical protein
MSGVRRVAEFVNADVIAKEQELSDIEAGRVTLARLTALAEARKASGAGTSAAWRTSSISMRWRRIPGY